MEFRRGAPERRQDRRVCPKCSRKAGTKPKCASCGTTTEARIQINWYVGGSRKRKLTDCWREEKATAVLQREEDDYWRQQRLGTRRQVGGRLRVAADAYEKVMSATSDNNRKQITTALNSLIDGIGDEQQVHMIEPADIEDYKDDALEVLEGPTVRSYMGALRGFFRWMEDEGWIRRDPTRRVKLPKASPRKAHLRPGNEVNDVLQAAWEKAAERRKAKRPRQVEVFHMPAALTAFILGGWRKGELVNWHEDNTDLASRWAYVLEFDGDSLTSAWKPKTESSRRAIPLHPLVVAALGRMGRVALPDGSASPWVFPMSDLRKRVRRVDKRGRRQAVVGDRQAPGTSAFGKRLKEACTAAGVTRQITIHDLRRTFAVLLQEAGAPDSIIGQALGHRGSGVTSLNYLPRREGAVQQWVDRIEVDIPFLTSGEPRQGAFEIVDATAADPVTATNPPPDAGFPVADYTPGRGGWN